MHGILNRLAGLLTRNTTADGDGTTGLFPRRRAAAADPLTLSTVFRGVQVLQTAISGLPIREYRNGQRLDDVSPLVERPDVNRSRRDFIADFVASLALDGNAFVRLVRFDGQVQTCEILPPGYVTVRDTGNDPAAPVLRYSYLGHDYTPDQIRHFKFLNVPGRLRGLGPIGAAREEIESAQLARNYKRRFFDRDNMQLYGTTSQPVSIDSLRTLKTEFNKPGEPGDVKFLSSGVELKPLGLSMADLQYIETQKFDTTQIARLLGIPASIMLAAVDGSNLTYSNIEQSWIEFADYTLAAYAGEIEELFDYLLPRGRTARFDWDNMRRTNTSERFNAWATAIDKGFLTVDEVRADMGRQPLNPPTTTPSDGATNEQ